MNDPSALPPALAASVAPAVAPPAAPVGATPDSAPVDVPAEALPDGRPAWRKALPRVLGVLVLLAVGAAVVYFLFYTPEGRRWKNRVFVLKWVALHPIAAPLLFVAAYTLLGSLMMPVWWMQVLAGYCFGVVKGVLWVQVGATYAAVASLLISRWLIGEWFLRRVGQRMTRLRDLEEKMGHNGLLVVMAVRLCHVLPFGLSNYLMGLTRITVMDVALGTFWAGTSTSAFYVAVGNNRHVVGHGTFWASLAALNLVLLVPLILRYLKPEWFKKMGIE